MRKYISTKIDEFLLERFHINNLPSNIILLTCDLDKDGGIFLLYDKDDEEPIGYISFGLYHGIESFTTSGCYSENGYGAFLYESAMTYVYPNGLSMSRDSNTSDDALAVWFKFNDRKDVRSERINSDEITHKKEDWISGGFLDDDPDYRQSIFDLEDTRFFYNYGKDKLNKLIKIGKEYMNINNISEEDVEHMTWDLE